MKWLGGLVLTALIIVGLMTVLNQGSRSAPGLGNLGVVTGTEEAATAYTAEQARLVETDASGKPLYLLQARQLSQETSSDEISAEDLQLNYVPPDAAQAGRPWMLTARRGTVPGGSKEIRLTGNVRLTGQPAGAREPVRLETSALDFEVDQQIARTKQSVNFYWGSRRLTARGLNADLKRGTLRLESSVHGRLPP
jgi:LPS export ABC transporter protein LptC